MTPPLPLLDEHATTIAAGPGKVWSALLATVAGAFSGRPSRVYARLVGCDPARPGGPRPLAEGGTIPGFRVAAATPHRELVLSGGHRFSTYTLTFRLDPLPGGPTRLTAETRAEFPGVTGRAYRTLLVGTGAHVTGVRRLLSSVRRRSGDESR